MNIETEVVFDLEPAELRIEGRAGEHLAVVFGRGHEGEEVGGDRAIVAGALAHVLQLLAGQPPADLGRWPRPTGLAHQLHPLADGDVGQRADYLHLRRFHCAISPRRRRQIPNEFFLSGNKQKLPYKCVENILPEYWKLKPGKKEKKKAEMH